MNMFPKIHPIVSSLWLISAELYAKHALYGKQPEALRLNGQTKGLFPRVTLPFGLLLQLWWRLGKARVKRRAKRTVRMEINKIK